MSVGVGSLQDPLEAQGLAHYLEHMLFMGTTKYPNENDYSNVYNKLRSLLPKILVSQMPTPRNKKPITIFRSLAMRSDKHSTDSLSFLLAP